MREVGVTNYIGIELNIWVKTGVTIGIELMIRELINIFNQLFYEL